MIFRQFIHEDLGCASYLVGDERAGVAAVVDPSLDVEPYLATARYLGVRIAHVLETHNHADHVSGHGRLVEATGATIHLHRDAAPDYPHEPVDDGWTLALGDVRITALHTPGHRPEHTAYLLTDTSRGERPWAALTGDSLFVGDVARPDLAVDKEDGARAIFRTLRDRLLVLPAETEVWPGHLGGSMCGGPGMSLKVSSTIGYEREQTPLLAERDEDRFVAAALADLGPQPPNFQAIVAINRGPLTTAPPRAVPLTPGQVARRQADGAVVVDVRTDRQFDDAHVPGAVAVTILRGGFGTKLAWLAEHDREIVLVGHDDADALQAESLASSVGISRVVGYLAGGMTAWREDGRPVDRVERVPATGLHERLAADPALQILDVREAAEWRAGRIPGSTHVPYHDIRGIPEGLDPARPIAVVCASGQRSAVAVGLLQRAGAARVVHVVDGGVGDWIAAGHPAESG